MRYEVIEANSKDELAEVVEEYLRMGWSLAGGVFVVSETVPWVFYQAVHFESKQP